MGSTDVGPETLRQKEKTEKDSKLKENGTPEAKNPGLHSTREGVAMGRVKSTINRAAKITAATRVVSLVKKEAERKVRPSNSSGKNGRTQEPKLPWARERLNTSRASRGHTERSQFKERFLGESSIIKQHAGSANRPFPSGGDPKNYKMGQCKKTAEEMINS